MYKSKSKQTAESKAKAKFRRTAKWKNFRKMLKKKRKVDFVTQKPLLKGFQVHHANMQLGMYNVLDEDEYYTLSKTSHEVVHWLFRYTDWRDMLNRLYTILEHMERVNPR